MVFSVLCALFFLLALRDGLPLLSRMAPGGAGELLATLRAKDLFLELEETLLSGNLPRAERWEALAKLADPWGHLAFETVTDLRTRGGQVVPTLRRLRELAESHEKSLRDGKARSAQALVQAMVCVAIVPVFGSMLYLLLPGLETRPGAWISVCALAMVLGSGGGIWMMKMAENARWGGLAASERPWVLATQCAGERILSLLRSGVASDQAWSQALSATEPALALAWGGSVWEASTSKTHSARSAVGRVLFEWGGKARQAIHVSLLEGQPCQERVESLLTSLRMEIAAGVERELQLLGSRVLKPLFICVAPSVLMLLGFGMVICWQSLGMDF